MFNKKLLYLSILTVLTSSFSYANPYKEVTLKETKIISTTGFETDLKNIASNPIIITQKEISNKNYQTIEELLSDVASINIISNGRGSVIDIRGQGYKAKTNVQILVDGIPLNSLDSSHMVSSPIDTIDINVVEKIEIIPGGGAVLYGSGTSGGVINIITKSNRGFRGNIGYRHDEEGGNKYITSIGTSFEKIDFSLNYSKNYVKGYRNYDKANEDYFDGKILYKINEKQDIAFKYSKFESNNTYPKFLTRKQLSTDDKQTGYSHDEYDESKTDKYEYSLTYNNKINNHLELNIITFSQKTEVNLDSKSYMRYPMSMKSIALFSDDKYGIKPKLKYSYEEGSNLILGIDYINNKAKRFSNRIISVMPKPILTINDLKKETISSFLLNTYKFDKLEFLQGIRYEKAKYKVERSSDNNFSDNTDDNNLAYELALNYVYSSTGNTYFKYIYGFTSPPPALLTNKNENGYYLNNLKSEKYDTFEIGTKDFISFSYVTGTIFYTKTKDEITTDVAGGMPPKTIDNYNIGETERYGAELRLEQWFGKLSLTESYAYVHAKIKDGKRKDNTDQTGNFLGSVPENKFSFGAKYDINSKLNIGTDVVYRSSYYLNNDNLGGKQNSSLITNLRLNYFPSDSLKLYAGINNLFNENYYKDIDYSKRSKEYTYDPASKRNYYLGFNYSF